jgi:heavy metal sensor kinase
VKPLSLRTSLTLLYTALLALLLSALGFAYHRVLARQLDAESTAVLEEITRGLHGYLQFRGGVPVLEYSHDDPEVVAFIEEATRYYQIYDAEHGRLLVQSTSFESLGLHYTPGEVAVFRQSPQVYDVQTDRGRFRILSSVVAGPGSELYLLQVGESLSGMDRALAQFDRLLVWGIGVSVLAAALVGRYMAGRALTPLSRFARATRAISITNLSRRLPVRGAEDELDEVAHAFNQALERVEHAVGEMRQFSAALAHELRTPLAVLRGETELALTRPGLQHDLRARLESQLDEFDRLTRLINQILTLARAEGGEIVLARAAVDLVALAATVVEQLEPVAEARQVALRCSSSGPVPVVGDTGWLERLLLVLLDNAIKFTPPGGRVDVQLANDPRGATFTVRDTGIGIAADALPHVFERFYRADLARSRETEGAGLGLALAKWIVDRHGGSIEVASRPGQGATFTVRLPGASAVPHS